MEGCLKKALLALTLIITLFAGSVQAQVYHVAKLGFGPGAIYFNYAGVSSLTQARPKSDLLGLVAFLAKKYKAGEIYTVNWVYRKPAWEAIWLDHNKAHDITKELETYLKDPSIAFAVNEAYFSSWDQKFLRDFQAVHSRHSRDEAR